ncbi:GDSL family lipase [Paenibacillus sp. FSL H8-0548]|uniref:SGNH/GDSL hydrolase family protein n=1 Tax=Paenibacillus sp. FSL H8-0548 TaxID=1920422 RepID=UPI00096C8ED3|nr:SGNH/GDSL hydrolase family protein [Paenibacillus sp. FSL H8-0548]OMF27610.1 GDSL family lipase [Paenibacillus sp. FSL H8-0548]
MKHVQLSEEWIHGAVSLERRGSGLKPWRIPYADYELYPPDGIGGKAEICAGIRLRFQTDSLFITLKFEPLTEGARIDCMADGNFVGTADLAAGEMEAAWTDLPSGRKVVEIWLPQNIGMTLTVLLLDADAYAEPAPDTRPKWITYGSSITQCVAADSPAQTWPSIASSIGGLNLTCLGYSGNCQMEPMVARLIRDLPADIISLCLGINIYGAESLSARALKSSVIGMLEIIREKHRNTPLLLISPIFASEREATPNKLDLTVSFIREEIAEVAALLRNRGDQNLYYRDGREWFSEADAVHLSDGLHPDAQGYKLLGERFRGRMLEGVVLNS